MTVLEYGCTLGTHARCGGCPCVRASLSIVFGHLEILGPFDRLLHNRVARRTHRACVHGKLRGRWLQAPGMRGHSLAREAIGCYR